MKALYLYHPIQFGTLKGCHWPALLIFNDVTVSIRSFLRRSGVTRSFLRTTSAAAAMEASVTSMGCGVASERVGSRAGSTMAGQQQRQLRQGVLQRVGRRDAAHQENRVHAVFELLSEHSDGLRGSSWWCRPGPRCLVAPLQWMSLTQASYLVPRKSAW